MPMPRRSSRIRQVISWIMIFEIYMTNQVSIFIID